MGKEAPKDRERQPDKPADTTALTWVDYAVQYYNREITLDEYAAQHQRLWVSPFDPGLATQLAKKRVAQSPSDTPQLAPDDEKPPAP